MILLRLYFWNPQASALLTLVLSEVIEAFAKFDLLLKTERIGGGEIQGGSSVHKNVEGTFSLNQMQQEH